MATQQAFRRGDAGDAVREIRDRLTRLEFLRAGPDDATGSDAVAVTAETFDADLDAAVRHFQQAQGLTVDGVVGPQTYRRLDEARWRLGDRVLSYVVNNPIRGDDVAALQQRLSELGFDPGYVDGIYAQSTENAVRAFQRNSGLPVDGTCGPATLQAFGRLGRPIVGGARVAMREHEAIRRSGPTLTGKVVVVDPGHGGGDPGASAHDLHEADLVADLAARVEGRLAARGATAFLTRGRGEEPGAVLDDEARAAFANEADADLVISLHVDQNRSAAACGVATYYYGGDRQGAHSAIGERLAALLQHEIVARTDLADCQSHAKTWELLRATRMPAVRVELGYLSNPGDAARLADPAFRDTIAEAIVAAITDLYLPEDPPD